MVSTFRSSLAGSADNALMILNRHCRTSHIMSSATCSAATVLLVEAGQRCPLVRCLLPHSVFRRASAWCKPFKPPLQITQLALCCKNFFRCAGRDCSALWRTISFIGGRRAEEGCRRERKVQKHAARRGGSGTEGAVAQFSMGRRCGNWKCTGRLWSTTGTCTGVTVTPDGTCVSRYDSVHYESCSISEAPSR